MTTENESAAMENLRRIRVLGLKATFLCNSRCGFCWQPHVKRGAEVSDRVMENLMPLLLSGNLKVLQPAGGEIFLWKPLKGLLDLTLKHNDGLKMYLVTNGTLFDSYWYERSRSGLFSVVSLSINAPNRAAYQMVCGRDNFEKVKSALETLAEIKKTVDFKIQISFVMTLPLMGHLSEFVDLAAGKADALLIREWKPPLLGDERKTDFYRENHIPPDMRPAVIEEIMKTAELADARGLLFDYTQYAVESNRLPFFSHLQCPSYDYSDARCNHLFNQLQVDQSGGVRLGCNFSGFTIGNLNEHNIVEILANPQIAAIREEIVSKENYIACPPKVTAQACPHAMRQLRGMTGEDRYVEELPEFGLKRDSLIIRSPRLRKIYKEALSWVGEAVRSGDSVEVGQGMMTVLLATSSREYSNPDLAVDSDFYSRMCGYASRSGLKLRAVPPSDEKCSEAVADAFDIAVVNNHAVFDTPSLMKQIRPGGYLVCNAETQHSESMQMLVLHLLQAKGWSLSKRFDYLTFVFQKVEAEQSVALFDEYRRMTKVVASFTRMAEAGIKTVAIFGGGGYTQWLQSFSYLYAEKGPLISAVLDDFPTEGMELFNRKVEQAAGFDCAGADALVLATEIRQDDFARRCRSLYGDGIQLVDLFHRGNKKTWLKQI